MRPWSGERLDSPPIVTALPTDDPEVIADRIASRLRSDVAARLPLRATAVDELALEARPAIHALLFATATERADDATSLEHHETTAMVTLLGRSFAMHDATPTAAMGIVPALLAAFRAEGLDVPASLDAPLATVFVEGYVRGREERLHAEALRDAVHRIPVLHLFRGCAATVLRGDYGTEELTTRFEEVARQLFAHETRVFIADVEGLADPAPGTIRALVGLHDNARMLGLKLVLAGVESGFREQAALIGLDFAGIDVAPDFAAALERALEICELGLRPDGFLTRPLRALRNARRNRSPRQ